MADENIKSVGFAIITPTQDAIEQDAVNILERELTDDDWELINEDIGTLEGNTLEYISDTLEKVRDEGHSGDELIGTTWYDANNTEQVGFVMSRSEHADNADPEVADAIYEGTHDGLSEVGRELLWGQVRIEFFDVPEEDYDEWLEAE